MITISLTPEEACLITYVMGGACDRKILDKITFTSPQTGRLLPFREYENSIIKKIKSF